MQNTKKALVLRLKSRTCLDQCNRLAITPFSVVITEELTTGKPSPTVVVARGDFFRCLAKASQVRNKELEFVDSAVFLEITLDDRLQWGLHTSKLAKRLSSAAYAVKKNEKCIGRRDCQIGSFWLFPQPDVVWHLALGKLRRYS
ncbi:hypothetical protein EVAR_27413_1 [Eumeta japonica]|uniref:Uncharacterized protein n=1 Tax=Eumeta variegata TaxID=151549 RepID=A0A4C1X322_EUMVA|nr:hypothetical protein EVAR_27413_1 [Eumeta japonica]